jgi:CRP/FNR family transcriptional regulator, cyclic AMP receptor protein
MNQSKKPTPDPKAILNRMDGKKSESKYHKDQSFCTQGDAADCIYFIQTGKVKVAVVSPAGKEAVVGILQPGDFCGEECLSGHKLRIATVTALTDCVLVRLEKVSVVRALRDDPAFSELFISYLMARSIRMQEDLVDQLLNSTEKRLARLLLILANFGKEDRPEPIVPRISQETLAEMIGTTRTHVNFFMTKFRQLGFIDYNGDIKVNRSLLNMLLHDRPQIESRGNS